MLCGQSLEAMPSNDLSAFEATAKLDGWRVVIARTVGGRIEVYGGRNGTSFSGKLPYLEEALLEVLPRDTVVDGELISTIDHGHIASVMNASSAHRPSKALPALEYVMFDILFSVDVDLRGEPLWARREALSVLPSKPPLVRKMVALEPDAVTLDMVMELGFEGLVLKRKASSYSNGRSGNWIKIKPSLSIDCEIINLPHDGKGEFKGLVGAVEFRLPNGEVGRASGMTRAVRVEMTNYPHRYLAKIAEFQYQYMTKDGRLRHPRFMRVRSDLEASAPAPKKAPVLKSTSGGKQRMRNYAAMKKPGKLEQCIEELRARSGDAYNRCIAAGGNPEEDLKVAEAALAKRTGAAV
jgi:ATP-dependent DNA ligase